MQKSRAQSKVNAKRSGALLKKRAAKLHIFFITAKEGQGKKNSTYRPIHICPCGDPDNIQCIFFPS